MSRRAWTSVVVLAGYCAVSFVYFGLPFVSHPGRDLIGTARQYDPELFIWSFAWWPHAIESWTNPFFTHAIYAPTGINITWTASAPGIALAFSPLTVLVGPAASYNVAAMLLFALAAWTAFLLCRELTESLFAAVVGGYLFGFSSYMVGHQTAGHLNLTGVFLVPLVGLAMVRYVRREIGAWGLVWRLGAIVGYQITISTEIALTLTIMLGLALLLAGSFFAAERGRIVSSLPPIVGGYALGAVLAAPFLYFLLTGMISHRIADPPAYSGDLLNIVLPTQVTAWGGPTLKSVSAHFPGNDNERGSYLGIPVLIMVVWYAIRAWRRPGTRFLVVSLVLAEVLTIGTAIHVDGHRLGPAPWAIPARWNLVDNVLPERLSMYAALAAAVVVALWIGSTRGTVFRRPYVLPLLAVATLVPSVWQMPFHERPERWAFFTDHLYKTCIPKNETLAVFPFARWGDAMLWQAESGFWFRMPEGNMGPSNLPENWIADPTVFKLQYKFVFPKIRPSMRELLAFGRRHRVDRFASPAVPRLPRRHADALVRVAPAPRRRTRLARLQLHLARRRPPAGAARPGRPRRPRRTHRARRLEARRPPRARRSRPARGGGRGRAAPRPRRPGAPDAPELRPLGNDARERSRARRRRAARPRPRARSGRGGARPRLARQGRAVDRDLHGRHRRRRRHRLSRPRLNA